MRRPRSLGPYTVVRELDRGGMGSIFEVVHEETGAHYAAKVLLPGLDGRVDDATAKRFRGEAEALGRTQHPNVVGIHAADLDAEVPYLIQDLLPGGTLQDKVANGPLDPALGVEILVKLGSRPRTATGFFTVTSNPQTSSSANAASQCSWTSVSRDAQTPSG
jgi:serine/threonine protein kinase